MFDFCTWLNRLRWIVIFVKIVRFALLQLHLIKSYFHQTMLAAIKMEVMTPSVDSPDEGSIGKQPCTSRSFLFTRVPSS